MHVGRKSKPDEADSTSWHELDINKFTIPKGKSIFMFGGNTTTTPRHANGNANAILSFLNEEQKKKNNLFSFYYDGEPFYDKRTFNKDYENSAIRLFERVFKPMLFDNKGNIKELKGIEKVFDNMIFTAHCGGSAFVNIIVDSLYNTLLKYYPKNTANFLINKIQYFAYAPNRMPQHNLNALIITPYIDGDNTSWGKALSLVEDEKIDIDYPKHSSKRLIKALKQGTLQREIESTFSQSKGIMFKTGNTTFIIPSQMNPDISIGDHSIEVIYKPKTIKSGTKYEITAQIMNQVTQMYLLEFLNKGTIDTKNLFSQASTIFDSHKPNDHVME